MGSTPRGEALRNFVEAPGAQSSARVAAALEAGGSPPAVGDRTPTWRRFRMPSVAVIGPDGAGKTTITRKLAGSGILPFRYMYMGIDIHASNYALITSRLAGRFKTRSGGGVRPLPGTAPVAKARARRGLARASAGLVNRFADEWFRQLISWYFQLRGFVVLYDRHYTFDFGPGVGTDGNEASDLRLHRWLLRRLYPRPDIVIFLDAPGHVLFARKGESTPEELESRRQAFLRIGATHPRFVRVDATKSLDEVYADVVAHVARLCGRTEPAVAGTAR